MVGRINNILLILVFLSNAIGRQLYAITSDKVWYFGGEALSWILMGIYLYRIVTLPFINGFWYREIIKGLLLLIVNNTLDEYLFDPCAIGLNEYALLLTILIRLTYIYYKR